MCRSRTEPALAKAEVLAQVGICGGGSPKWFDFADPPLLGELRFQRTVEAQDRLSWGRAEFGSGRRIGLAAGTREALRRVGHRSRLIMKERERPERCRRNSFRYPNFVGLAAIEGVLVGIQKVSEILRADPRGPTRLPGSRSQTNRRSIKEDAQDLSISTRRLRHPHRDSTRAGAIEPPQESVTRRTMQNHRGPRR